MNPSKRLFGCLLLLLLASAAASAQRHPIDPPLIGRPADFSDVVGKYEIKASASPVEVEVEHPIELRVVITGQGPAKYEPKRERLRIFPESLEKDFYVADVREEDKVNRAEKSWTFVYRLKPKTTKIDAIEGIKLVYFDPAHRGKDPFLTDPVDLIKITVKPRKESIDPIISGVEFVPESFCQLVPFELNGTTSWCSCSSPLACVVAFLVAVPLTCGFAAIAWKRFFPDERQRRRRQRSRAADDAVAQLRAGSTAVWQIVHRYLQQRFDVILAEPTPAEIERLLLRRGFGRELCVQGKTLLQDCDGLRFGPTPVEVHAHLEQRAKATQWIAALEADPCAR